MKINVTPKIVLDYTAEIRCLPDAQLAAERHHLAAFGDGSHVRSPSSWTLTRLAYVMQEYKRRGYGPGDIISLPEGARP